MLTYPSDSLPQIVCPMDEDAIPPNPVCSAPSHSDPPPPLLPLSSITPSCANDGLSRHRRSGRIQGVRAQTPKKQSSRDSRAAQKPSRQNPSPTKKQREGGSMVQASQSKQPRVESRHVHEKQNEGGFEFSYTAEHQDNQKDQKNPLKKTNVSTTESVVEQCAANTTQNHTDTTKSNMDSCRGLALGHNAGNASASKGWVIGPLFQSFKSKMASFTEIVMSPVKLFRANSPPLSTDHHEKLSDCQRPFDGSSDVEHSEPSNTFYPEEQSETGNVEAEANHQKLSEVENAQNTKTVEVKYCKKLVFDVELSTHSFEKGDECQKENNLHDSVPLQPSPLPCFVSEKVSESLGSNVRSSILVKPSVSFSASPESTLEISSAMEDQKNRQAAQLKPLPRKRTRKQYELKKFTCKDVIYEFKKEESDLEVSDEQLSLRNSVKSNKADSSVTDKTVPLSSSDCYTQPDTDCLQLDGGDDTKIESCHLVQQSLRNNLNDRRTLDPNTDIHTAAGHSQSLVKRKKLTKNQELLNMTSDSGILRGLRPLKGEAVLANTIVDMEETLKPVRKRHTVSTRANGKGKGGRGKLPVVNEEVLKTENSPDAIFVCSLNKSSGVSENNQMVCSSSKTKRNGSCKRLKTRAGFDVSINNSMDLETTVAISSTKQAEQDLLSDVLVRPDIKQLHSASKCRNINKPLKRKSPIQASSVTESDSTLVSTSSLLSMEPQELMPTDFNTSLPVQREGNQPSKRPKKCFRGAVKSESGGAQETKQFINNLSVISKESHSQEGKSKISVDPVYFEMTPFESNHQPVSSSSQPHTSCSVLLNHEVKHVIDEKEKSPASVADEVFAPDISVSGLRSSARRVNIKPRKANNQSRKSRVLHSTKCKGEEMTNSVTMEDADLATAATRSSENGFSRRLLRSYSCPEIPSFRSSDTSWTASLHSPHHSRTPTSHQHQSSHTPHVPHAHRSLQRARRHTVCSVEVEREIAPLCLRKEVYPSRRPAPYDSVIQHLSPSLALSPSTTLSALASCFLSSPLAFLSKKVDSRCSAASPSTSSHVSSPSSSLASPLTSSTWQLPGFLQRTDSSHVTLDCSSSGNLLECETERRQQCEEDDGEDTSSSSQEYEDVGMREEKALSDSEIKVEQKNEERGKVSSIRIRKTLPKPQNNLTPMGLPKPIRLKKKEFSLEEIYTNKNFNKPPESRLETIFEVPLNRRNGSESWFGQRRVKRFLEFLEVGEVRKSKKSLVGVGKTGISSSRTRRGGFTKDEPPLTLQDVDSLLCAKLDELNLWLIHDQKNS